MIEGMVKYICNRFLPETHVFYLPEYEVEYLRSVGPTCPYFCGATWVERVG